MSGFRIFSEQYARARQAQCEGLAEEIMDIARNSTAATAHADRVKVDALKWVLSKLHPERYGDRTQVEMSGRVGVEVSAPDHAPAWMRDWLDARVPPARLPDVRTAEPPSEVRH